MEGDDNRLAACTTPSKSSKDPSEYQLEEPHCQALPIRVIRLQQEERRNAQLQPLHLLHFQVIVTLSSQ